MTLWKSISKASIVLCFISSSVFAVGQKNMPTDAVSDLVKESAMPSKKTVPIIAITESNGKAVSTVTDAFPSEDFQTLKIRRAALQGDKRVFGQALGQNKRLTKLIILSPRFNELIIARNVKIKKLANGDFAFNLRDQTGKAALVSL